MKKTGLVLLLICAIAFVVDYCRGNIPLEIPVLDKIAEMTFDSHETDDSETEVKESPPVSVKTYVGNRRNHKLHSIHCDSLPYEDNRIYFSTIEEAEEAGYTDKHYECMGN